MEFKIESAFERPKFVAVTVTYNRISTFIVALRAIMAQTLPVDRIIIIDNASSDGTSNWVRDAGLLNNPLIHYVRLPSNVGGAGGFHEGMKRALKEEADWIWVMDDDVAPAPDCLEQLLKWKDISECLMPLRVNVDGTANHWEQYVDIYSGWKVPLRNISFSHGKEIVFTNAACFEGMLVSRRVLEQVGLPDSKYFIGEDDTLFGIMASTYTNNAYVRDAVIHRQLPTLDGVSPWKAYFLMRNAFYLFTDVQNRFGFSKHRFDKAKFVLLRIFDLLLSIKKGPKLFWSNLNGFKDGYIYLQLHWRDTALDKRVKM